MGSVKIASENYITGACSMESRKTSLSIKQIRRSHGDHRHGYQPQSRLHYTAACDQESHAGKELSDDRADDHQSWSGYLSVST